jgi:hypothetical protein
MTFSRGKPSTQGLRRQPDQYGADVVEALDHLLIARDAEILLVKAEIFRVLGTAGGSRKGLKKRVNTGLFVTGIHAVTQFRTHFGRRLGSYAQCRQRGKCPVIGPPVSARQLYQ